MVSGARIRTFATVGLVAQPVFVLSWLLAQLWQGSHYSALAHTISDMYAVGAPHAWFLIGCITLTGAGTVLFALFGARPALRAAGRPAVVGIVLLTVSILGLGDLLTPWEREGCRIADPGCTPAAQMANSGGQLDGLLSTLGLFALVAAGFFLATAMKRLPVWRDFVWPTRWVTIAIAVLLAATVFAGGIGLGGLCERLLAAAAAAGVAGLALAVIRATDGPALEG